MSMTSFSAEIKNGHICGSAVTEDHCGCGEQTLFDAPLASDVAEAVLDLRASLVGPAEGPHNSYDDIRRGDLQILEDMAACSSGGYRLPEPEWSPCPAHATDRAGA